MEYKLSMIACMNNNEVIGRSNDLPWKCQSDMKFFIEKTRGKNVIMGRKTWDSLPKKPLPGRRNIVITRDPSSVDQVEGAIFLTMDQALDLSKEEECFVIGGSEIYSLFMPFSKDVFLNIVEAPVKYGDTFFPYDQLYKSHRLYSTVEGDAVIEIPSDGIREVVRISYHHFISKSEE